MRKLLIPLLAAVTLPTAVNADWQRQIYDESYPIFQQNYDNGFKFSEVGDTEFACKSFKLANNELKNHLATYQKYNSTDWFSIRAQLKTILEACGR